MGKLERGWEITKISFSYLKKDKRFLIFSLLAGFLSLFWAMFIISFSNSFNVYWKYFSIVLIQKPTSFDYLLIFIVYFGIFFIATFLNVALVYILKNLFENKKTKLLDSIKFAFSRIHKIFLWSILAATVGVILRIIERRSGGTISRLITLIPGLAWSIATIFVVPIIAFKNLGPFDAIKKSAKTIKKTWGEKLTSSVVFSAFISGMFVLFVLIFILMVFLESQGISFGINGSTFLSIWIICLLLVTFFFDAIKTIFNTSLFVYSETGKIPKGYNRDIMRNAFEKNK